jgi:hypothetical protein
MVRYVCQNQTKKGKEKERQDGEAVVAVVVLKKIDKRGLHKSISHVRRIAYSTVHYKVGPE